ncbi:MULTISPECIES: DNA glycosylase AlkZ-like family protein [unclassified Actinomyces]|uniref:DNA glycosylase AlkZ-like family protein n=1 Tax=unclassified Actinomyces TaxID=2609248 RepID=UPI000D597C1B|nr:MULTISPECIES: crosslink repair DNA glycosylase YcaQ family protein [unclassified Actinomyces]RAX23180.1 winged helix DNA-binding domain-containing protein [Actinomyces sp. Z3]
MPAVRSAAPREMSYLRILAQGLVPATTAPDVVEAVRRQLAVQGQQPSAVPHALILRADGATGSAVDAAFASGHLVRSWPMRGTIHITTSADHHWLREALMHRSDAWTRQTEARLGIDDAVLGRAADAALTLIGREGPVTRVRLIEAWREAGLLDSADASSVRTWRRRHLLVRLQRAGLLVQGPRRGNEHLIMDARDLPGADTGPGGSGGAAHGAAGHRAALAEIARRYATSHGPVSAADLARWTTLPQAEAARALEDAVEITNAAAYPVDPDTARVPLVRARAEGGLRGSVRLLEAGAGARPGRDVLYLRADLPELLEGSRRAAGRTLFLPSFDELHVGYKDRLCLTDAAGERLICPASNGMFRPLLVDRGRVVAVRPVGEGLLWADGARRSARLEQSVERAVRRVERRLSR